MPNIHSLKSADEEEQIINDNDRVVIFFGSPTCGHCRAITPIYNSLSDKYPTVVFAYVDCSVIKADNIQGYPTFVGYQYGNVVNIVLGNDERGLVTMIKSLL